MNGSHLLYSSCVHLPRQRRPVNEHCNHLKRKKIIAIFPKKKKFFLRSVNERNKHASLLSENWVKECQQTKMTATIGHERTTRASQNAK